jgi:hypothetical protein
MTEPELISLHQAEPKITGSSHSVQARFGKFHPVKLTVAPDRQQQEIAR